MSDVAVELMTQADRARRANRLADAHRDLAEAVALCRRSGVRRELLQALKALGQIERDLGHGNLARPLYEEAVAICRDEGDPLTLAHTVRHLGDIHQDAGRVELAEPCYLEALAIYRSDRRAPPLDLANAIRPLAILKDDAGEVEEARRLWEEARDLYAAVNVPEGVAESSARLAQLVSADALRRRVAEAARRVLTRIFSDDRCRNAVSMLEKSEGEYEVTVGNTQRVRWEELESALRAPDLQRPFTETEAYIRDCFQALGAGLEIVERDLRAGLLDSAGVEGRIADRLSRLRKRWPVVVEFFRRCGFELAPSLIERFPGEKP